MRSISVRRRPSTCVVEAMEDRLHLSAALALDGPSPAKGNISPSLLSLAAAPTTRKAGLRAMEGIDGGLVIGGGKVALKIVADNVAAVPTLRPQLASLGFVEATNFLDTLIGAAPFDAVARLGATPGVASVSPAYAPPTFAGSIVTQGDAAVRAQITRGTFGVDGSGVKVGVISDSFNQAASSDAADDVASGDLPEWDDLDILDDSLPGHDEGRAMMQIIHDLAPGAKLAFHTAGAMTDAGPVISDATMAQAILALADAGCDIIVDDIGAPDEPMYLDGLAASAVDRVSAEGTVYFSSAGNGGRTGYESAFDDSGMLVTINGQNAGVAHDFDPGPDVDTRQRVTIAPGSAALLEFQWDEPFRSITGVASASDIDIFLLEADSDQVVAIGGQDNTAEGVGDAFEILSFANFTSASEFDLVITRFSGPSPGRMKYVNRQSTITIDEFDTESPTLFGHQNSSQGAAVGAAPWFQTPAFGVDPAALEPFSSVGGTPILFDSNGQRLSAPLDRFQPRFVATDGGNTTFFGGDSEADDDDLPNFFGTSAAAPEAAAVAALMLQHNHDAKPPQIISTLQRTALDMDDPDPSDFQTGRDDATGAGLIQADKAVEAVGGDAKVAAAYANGIGWSAHVRRYLAERGLGDATNGFAIDVANKDAPPLPWANVNILTVQFDRPVATNPRRPVRVTSSNGQSYRVQSGALGSDGSLMVRLGQPLAAGKVKIEIELTDPSPITANVEFTVLPGDVNRSGGAVQANDLVLTRNLIGRSVASPGAGPAAYSVFADVNADNVINAADLVLVRNRIGSRSLMAPLRMLRDDRWIWKTWDAGVMDAL